MNSISKYRIGLRFGLITGAIYILLLFFRYRCFSSNPTGFGLFAVITYILILFLFLFTGIARKKELGGYAEFKEIFQSIFITILITEVVYILFNLIYLKFIDPTFWIKFRDTSLAFYKSQHWDVEQMEQAMKSFKDVDKATEPLGLIKGFGYSVIIDCVFGMIFTLIIRRKRPISPANNVEPKL